jgi:hypothetical protein
MRNPTILYPPARVHCPPQQVRHPKGTRNARIILARLLGTPQSPERIARRRRVPIAYVCGLFDGFAGPECKLGLAYMDDPRTGLDLDYLEGVARGEQLAAEEPAE